MTDSIQITIPDLGDDDFGGLSTTTPFGRSGANAFGGGGASSSNAFSAGLGFGPSEDSPTLTTPIALGSEGRSFFGGHARGDSVNSIESTGSTSTRFAYPNRSQTSFTTQSSFTSTGSSTPATGFSKKTSFASIRNAFKSGGSKFSEPPPLPSHSDLSILKAGFNISTSSLSSVNTQILPSRGGRPSTPSDTRYRAGSAPQLKKGHGQAKSYHSQSSSVPGGGGGGGGFSDGSDGHGGLPPGGGLSSYSPPPVPRFPNSFGLGLGGDMLNGRDTPSTLAIEPGGEEDRDKTVDINPKTPSDFALHAVFMRFATSAEAKIDTFLRQALETDPPLPTFLGPGVDPKFDETLRSLGQIASKNPKPVLDSIMRWRRSQLENVGSEFIRFHMSMGSPSHVVSSSSNNDHNHHHGLSNGGNGFGGGGGRVVRTHDVPGLLNERKSLASIYIMCRALIDVVKTLSKDAVSEDMGYTLEKTTFDQFRKPDLKLLMQSKNHRTNAELSAELLGCLAGIRFVSVTDRFLAELKAVALGQVPKDLDMKYENLVLGLKHIQIKVWPPEAFEDGAEFMETLSKSFAHAHGHRLKSAFAETLVGILHPIGQTAQAETNNPMWAKAIEAIYPKAREMSTKPRYWNVAFPLLITSLCVSPEVYFRKYWGGCFESVVGKLKEKSLRAPLLNGLTRLIWTYLYRCPESVSTTAAKLDSILKHFFPSNRLGVYPSSSSSNAGSYGTGSGDESQLGGLEPFILVVHFVLSRHFEYGRDLCLELMQESTVLSLNSSAHAQGGGTGVVVHGAAFAPERTAIGVQAFLLSLHAFERENPTPAWPSSSDFFSIPSVGGSSSGTAEKEPGAVGGNDYPSSSEWLPNSAPFLQKQIIQESFDRVSQVLSIVAAHCSNSVGWMSVFDDQYQWSPSRMAPNSNFPYEENHNFVIVRRHPELVALWAGTGGGVGVSVAYSATLSTGISMLQTCFKAWPRLLHLQTVSVVEAIDMLLRGVVHVEASVGEAAKEALKRFLRPEGDQSHSLIVTSRITQYLFHPSKIASEFGSGTRLSFESRSLLDLWVLAVDTWIRELLKVNLASEEAWSEEQDDLIRLRAQEVEAGALVLLSHPTKAVFSSGVKVIRILGLLLDKLSPLEDEQSPSDLPVTFLPFVERSCRGSGGGGRDTSYLEGYEELLDKPELTRLDQWKASAAKKPDVVLRIADSGNDKDRILWRYVFPAWMQGSMRYGSPGLSAFRDSLIAAVTRYHPTISHLAGLSTRGVVRTLGGAGGHEKNGLRMVENNRAFIDQWSIWVKILCATATLPESARPTLTQIGVGGRGDQQQLHSRVPSSDTQTNFERERLSTSRGLFRYLTPFLDSEYTHFRDAAVLCISCFPVDAYPQLLEDLSLLAGRQFYDDPRVKTGLGISVEQNLGILSARPVYSDPQNKLTNNNIAGERLRRQERLHSAVARIYYLTSVNLQHQRSAGRQAALSNVLKFVRNTQSFLTTPEARDNHTLQRLRRYFCGTVERLFDGLGTLKDSDRFIPSNMHLALYRLCEEWCQFGPQTEAVKQRLARMQKMAAAEAPGGREAAVEKFQEETLLLSYAAVGAMSILCHKAFAPPGVSSGSPTNNHSPDHLKPLTSNNLLERLCAILSSSHSPTQARGKRALKSILLVNTTDKVLLDETLRRAIVHSDEAESNNEHIFEVLSDLVCSTEGHGFTFAQIASLALANLCHPLSKTRRQAFDMLESIHHQFGGLLTMSQFEGPIGNSGSGAFVHSHRQVGEFLAGEHPHEAAAMLGQLASWLPSISPTSSMMTMLLLQSVEYWIPNIHLMTEDRTRLSEHGHLALYHLMALTLRYGQSHPAQILVSWMRLVEPPNQSNGHATVRFLLEQSHKVGSTVFIDSAANIVACICQSAAGREIFQEVCSVIEPVRMLPTIEHKLTFPDAHDMEIWSELDALFVDGRPRLALGSAQFALLFLADVTLPRQWELVEQLPVLLHALFVHLDNRVSYIRLRVRRMLFQLLRSWAPGYDELPDRSNYPNRSVLKDELAGLELQADEMFWKEEEKGPEIEERVRWLSARVIIFLEPLCPAIRERWGTLAAEWGASCSIRSVACRSLQSLRALSPRVKMLQLALLLGRLSNTISASDDSIKLFATEIILTLNRMVSSSNFDMSLLPQIFWCACGALSTTIEQEYSEVLNLLETILTRIDFDDPAVVEALLSHRPLEWKGTASLQRNLLAGLRSSVTCKVTLRLLQRLTFYSDSRLIDPSDGRVRDLYTLSLPWCLYAMTPEQSVDDSLRQFAENIGTLAKAEGRPTIHKIMTSFAKGHFRTRDDFLRQSVSSLREHYGVSYWTEIVTLLMGLVLNQERWLRIQTMQVLKVLFQQRETRNPVELLGSELLMPLLRLLETDLASQALDVLEEPMTMSGGLAAKHVLRMSMHTRTLPASKDVDSGAMVFGVPEESGWCVVKADEMRQACRANIEGVFDTCSMSSRPSRIEFEPEEIEALASTTPVEEEGGEDLGGLVQNLHDLTTFFQHEESKPHPSSMPDRRLEARVAAILAKSTANDPINDLPPTPFVDVFHVGAMSSDEEDSDTDSLGSDSDDDAFYFDSPSAYSSAPNGARLH